MFLAIAFLLWWPSRLARPIQRALAGTLIIMLTSARQQGDIARSRQLGVQNYLSKPVRRTELRDSIGA